MEHNYLSKKVNLAMVPLILHFYYRRTQLLKPMKLLIRVPRTSLVKQYITSPAVALISSHQSCLVCHPD